MVVLQVAFMHTVISRVVLFAIIIPKGFCPSL
jgi:hypothetical protein